MHPECDYTLASGIRTHFSIKSGHTRDLYPQPSAAHSLRLPRVRLHKSTNARGDRGPWRTTAKCLNGGQAWIRVPAPNATTPRPDGRRRPQRRLGAQFLCKRKAGQGSLSIVSPEARRRPKRLHDVHGQMAAQTTRMSPQKPLRTETCRNLCFFQFRVLISMSCRAR